VSEADTHDLVVTSSAKRLSFCLWQAEGGYPGEPVFVAAPDATAEDDGVILSVMLNANTNRSCLLILDAHSFTEIAHAEAPHPP